METCFFCGLEKKDFNVEHFFPETIGGIFSNKICIKCNTTLNNRIDQPFLKNPYIGYQRIIHNLSKQKNRKIPNPFKGLKLIEGEDQYTLHVNSHGDVERRLCPKTEFPIDGDLSKGIKVTIDNKDVEIIDTIKERIAKNIGIAPDELIEGEKIVNKTERHDLQIEFPNYPLIFSFMKILVEFSLKYFPEYRGSKYAKMYVDFLLKGKFDYKLVNLLRFHDDNSQLINERFVSRFYKELNGKHAAFFHADKRVGLIGIIKVFDFVHSLVLSPEIFDINRPYFLFINGYTNKEKTIYTLIKFKDLHLEIEPLIPIQNFTNSTLVCENDSPIIYDQSENIICKNLFNLPSVLSPNEIIGDYINSLIFKYNNPELFFKCKHDGTMLPLRNLLLNAEIDKISDNQ